MTFVKELKVERIDNNLLRHYIGVEYARDCVNPGGNGEVLDDNRRTYG